MTTPTGSTPTATTPAATTLTAATPTPEVEETPEQALARAKTLAPLVDPRDAAAHLAGGGLLLDVRSAAGRASAGEIAGARVTDKADLGALLDPTSATAVTLDTPIVVVCGSERGSGPVAAELLARGYTDVRQVEGGVPGWVAAGLPTAPVVQAPTT